MARVTKKDIYARHNVEFKDGKVLSPIGWIEPLLKTGNTKTGKTVATWSMLTDKMLELYTQLDSVLSRADFDSVSENIGEEYVNRYVNIFGALMQIRNHAHKFERKW